MDTFEEDLEECISSVRQVRHLASSRTSNPRKRQKRGPEASTVKVKFYHIPENSFIPHRLTKDKNGRFSELFVEHRASGYGTALLIFLSITVCK